MTKRLIPFQHVTMEDMFETLIKLQSLIEEETDLVKRETLYRQFLCLGNIYTQLYELDRVLKLRIG